MIVSGMRARMIERFRTRDPKLARLAAVSTLTMCPADELVVLAGVGTELAVDAGTALASGRQTVITLGPAAVLVLEPREVSTVCERAPQVARALGLAYNGVRAEQSTRLPAGRLPRAVSTANLKG